MKKFNFPVFFILSLLLIVFVTSCSDTDDYKYFLVPVESISVPEEVSADETFEVRLSGTIGHDGCSSFDRFITEKQDTVLLVEAWGKLKANTYICPDVEVELVREKLKYSLEEPGTYVLKVRQPDGTFLDREFMVR